MAAILCGENISKIYKMGEVEVKALEDANFSVEEGSLTVILGPSGSGKSTLLNMIGGMDSPSAGKLFFQEKDLTIFNERQLTEYRRNEIGFVFQFYNIMANLTAKENIELAAEIAKEPLNTDDILHDVGLWDRRDHFPSQMSGGEQQRVSIARAVAKNPKLLLCDEPTGALDSLTGAAVLGLLQRIHREHGKTVMIITHNSDIAKMADRVIEMRNGNIIENYVNEKPMKAEEIKW